MPHIFAPRSVEPSHEDRRSSAEDDLVSVDHITAIFELVIQDKFKLLAPRPCTPILPGGGWLIYEISNTENPATSRSRSRPLVARLHQLVCRITILR